MPAFGAQPALVCALIDQTRGVFFARAHTQTKLQKQNKSAIHDGSGGKSSEVVGGRGKLKEASVSHASRNIMK